jgi:hypothetical protein
MASNFENVDFYYCQPMSIAEDSFSPDLMKCDFFDEEIIESRRLELLTSGVLLDPVRYTRAKNTREWHRSMPPPQCLSPRDGATLAETQDTLFIATLLQRDPIAQNFIEYLHESAPNLRIYLPESSDRVDTTEFVVHKKIERSEILARFNSLYFDFRSALAAPGPSFMSFLIGNMVLRPNGSRGDDAFWKFVSGLKHPFTKESDPLLVELPLRWYPHSDKSLTDTSFFCALDGPTEAIIGYSCSPERTWLGRCGRAFVHFLCPKCFGMLFSSVSLMN